MSSYYRSKFAGEIPLLMESNYHVWKNAVTIHLEAIRAYNHITGHAILPSNAANLSKAGEQSTAVHTGEVQEARDSYYQVEAKAKGVILGSTSPAFQLYLTGMTTAKEMWDTLRERLDKASSINGRLALRCQFLTLSPVYG